MKEITSKLSRQAIRHFEPVGEILRKEGKNDIEIIKIFNAHVENKVRKYYSSKKNETGIGRILKQSIEELKKGGYDSKAEVIFEYILKENKIPFKFQYKIGPYRTDFLIDKFLVVEVDGPTHLKFDQKKHDSVRDKYLQDLGYKVLRLPIWLISMSVESVILEIRDIIKEGGIANGEKKNKPLSRTGSQGI